MEYLHRTCPISFEVTLRSFGICLCGERRPENLIATEHKRGGPSLSRNILVPSNQFLETPYQPCTPIQC